MGVQTINVLVLVLAAVANFLLPPLVSFVVAKLTAKYQSKLEIDKRIFEWDHELEKIKDQEFSEMLTCVSELLRDCKKETYTTALQKINYLRVKEADRMGALLDMLYYEIESYGGKVAIDESKIKNLLANIVDERRKYNAIKYGEKATGGKK